MSPRVRLGRKPRREVLMPRKKSQSERYAVTRLKGEERKAQGTMFKTKITTYYLPTSFKVIIDASITQDM